MFVYEDKFDYEFHKQSVLEIMRVTRARRASIRSSASKPSAVPISIR